jgi:hypothetical protein
MSRSSTAVIRGVLRFSDCRAGSGKRNDGEAGNSGFGVHLDVDSTQIRDVRGWRPHDLREMTVSMADSMVQYGVVTPKSP